MNKTRNAIIDIIQPYMNKTVVEWCVYSDVRNKRYICNDKSDIKNVIIFTESWEWQVIWHYDITSIFKYIASFWFYVEHNSMDSITINTDKWLFFIPNKPLNLYNEVEETELLNLLLQIK